jgi:hypothetical protein
VLRLLVACLLELVYTDVLYRGHSSNLYGRPRVVNTGKRVHSEVLSESCLANTWLS